MDNTMISAMIILAGCVLLSVADWMMIKGYIKLSEQLQISGIWNRMILVFLSDLPLIFVCVTFMLHNKIELAVSGLAGAACFNLFMVCGLRAAIGTVPLNVKLLGEKLSVQILAGIVLVYLAGDYLLHGKYASRILSRSDGMVLIFIYLCYLINEILQIRKKHNDSEKKDGNKKSRRQDARDRDPSQKYSEHNGEISDGGQLTYGVIDIVIGFVMISVCAGMLVKGTIRLEEIVHWDENVTGLLIIGIGTNVLNLINIICVRKNFILQKMTENQIEMNILNLLLFIGLVLAVRPVSVSMNMMYDLIFLPVAGSAAWLMAYRKMEWNRVHGCVMLTMYISYMIYAVIR